MKPRILLLLAIPLLIGASDAGRSPSSQTAAAELGKLEPFVGRWRGQSWIQFGPDRRTAVVTEEVRFRQEGQLLTFEGKGTGTGADGGQVSTHDALGVVFWDARSNRLLFHAYRSGVFLESPLELNSPRSFRWSFPDPRSGATIRFTASITPDGKWLEVGEHSRDGQQWAQFFEMRLDRMP